MAVPIKIDFVPDWTARLKSRLYTKWRNDPDWNIFCEILGAQFDDLEASGQSMFTLLDIDNSEGVNLDLIGRIVGQPRLGVDDVTYRFYLRARILANRSSGGPEDIYKVFRALYGENIGLLFRTSQVGVKAFSLRVKGPITPTQAQVGVGFLRDSKEAGARGILEWQETSNNDMFTFMVGSTLTVATIIGATTLTLKDTSGYIAGGSLRIDVGLSTEEIVAAGGYTVTSGTTMTVTALTKAHKIGSAVELLEGPGKGFGRANSSIIGGLFAHAVQS